MTSSTGSTSVTDLVAPKGMMLQSTLWRNLSTRPKASQLPKGLDAAWNHAVSIAVPYVPRQRRFMERAAKVVDLEKEYADLSDARLRDAAAQMRDLFRLGRDTDDDLIGAFAVIREAAWRQLGMKPYPVQIAAAMALHAGCVAEMATGEGKTLAATMPATIAGWRGRGCHVITVNDYLAQRDAEQMGPVYRFCGLRVAHVVGESPPHDRRSAYNADITYCTNKEVAADLLRDRLAMGRQLGLPRVLLSKLIDGVSGSTQRLVLRGLEYAIVDEADSVLIDEAVTPLIISGSGPNQQQVEAFIEAAKLATQLEPGADYDVLPRYREIRFTRKGSQHLTDLTGDMAGIWSGVRRREELVNQALQARHLFLRDKQYVVQEDKIVIVDDSTGRLMPDRTWRDGLHQAVEAKEQIPVNPPKETLARISFQRFHRMYRHLCGMTGTAAEAQHELWRVYRLPVVRIATNRPCIRKQMSPQVYANTDAKWQAIVEHIKEIHAQGRPILVGTRSVRSSEHLGMLLAQLGLEHQILNAVRHKEEATVIAGAGVEGKITVATNMAGRGTDIKLGRDVAVKGGLHVIAAEPNESGRIDRQLFGRAGRQSDPGSAVGFTALDDELIQRYAPGWAKRLIRSIAGSNKRLGGRLYRMMSPKAQRRATHLAARQRQAVLKSDDFYEEVLGFAGSE